MASTRLVDLEKEFIVEVARVALNPLNIIFRVSTLLGMDRNALVQDCQNHKDDIEAIGNAFIRRWYQDNNDPNKFHRLKAAFEKVGKGGVFESVQTEFNFNIPPYPGHDQMELADEAPTSLDEKLQRFVEELPGLISNKNILWNVGSFSGCKNDEIEVFLQNNPRDIVQAGSQLIQSILNKKRGPLKKKVLDLQTIFRKAKKITRFNQLLQEHDLTEDDITGEEAPPANSGIVPPSRPAENTPEVSLHFFNSLVQTDQIQQSLGHATNLDEMAQEISRSGEFEYNEILYEAANLSNPTAESVLERLRSLSLGERGAAGGTRAKELQETGSRESGYSTMPYGQQASREHGQQYVG